MGSASKTELELHDVDVQAILAAKPGTKLVSVLAHQAEETPLEPHGNKSGKNNSRNRHANGKSVGSNQAEYLTRRIARDNPEVLERMKAGEFTSVRQAAIVAGIVKPPTPRGRVRFFAMSGGPATSDYRFERFVYRDSVEFSETFCDTLQ